MGKGLPEFYSSVLWKTEFVGHDLWYLAESSKQSVDVVVWFLAFNCQIWKEKEINRSRKELLKRNKNSVVYNFSCYTDDKRC
jgi:hypothetical protein